MKILFWNAHKNENINPYIVSLVQEHNVDALILADYGADEMELNNLFKSSGLQMSRCNTLGCKRISAWSNYVDVQAANQNEYYSIQIIQGKYIICGIHLMTDMYGDHNEERLALSQQIMHDIRECEEKIDSQRSIIIGDFNEMHSYTKKVGFAAAMESIQGSSTVEVDIQKDLGVQDKESNRFEVYLSVKGLDLYKYRMMFVDYGTVSYPVKIVMNEELAIEYCGRRKSQFDIASMKELEDMMNKIMDSETFISLVQSLINEALRKESGVIVNDVSEDD